MINSEFKQPQSPLSVVMIVKNESHNIRRCLNSITWAQEIICLDTGSTDNTVQICTELQAKVYRLDKWEGFGKARQSALQFATQPWVLALDADEVLSPELSDAIRQIIASNTAYNGYRIKVQTWFLDRWIKHCGWDRDYHLRLFKREEAMYNDAKVHESLVIKGSIGTVKAVLYHYSYPNLDSHQRKLIHYAKLWAEEQFALGKKENIGGALSHGFWKFFQMYCFKLGFLDGQAGLVLSLQSAYSTYYKHLLLWEMQAQ